MAINKKLIHFKSKQKFEEELANGNILDTSIVFIQETTEIYTHGQFYNGSTFDSSDIETSIQNILDNYATKEEIPTKVSELENDSNYLTSVPNADTDLGLVKSGGDVTITDGIITVNDDSHNHVINNIDGLQDALDAKANKTTTVNGYALSNNVTLNYEDVGADVEGAAAQALLDANDYTDTEIKSLSDDFTESITQLDNTKVDKVEGKGLSTNDYTTEEKDKLAGIAAGATANLGTITEIRMNGASKGSEGVVDLGIVLTEHQDISGKLDADVASTTYITKTDAAITYQPKGEYASKQEILEEISELNAVLVDTDEGSANDPAAGGNNQGVSEEILSKYLYDYAKKSELPTKTSQLENDSNFFQDNGVDDGVYAVTADGQLINYNNADTSAIGVALVIGKHYFMIEKTEDYDATYDTFYWSYNITDTELPNYSTINGVNVIGYLPTDGEYNGLPYISNDINTWVDGALSDYNGKSNSQVITDIASHKEDVGNILKAFNEGSYGNNQGNSDWYIPALGQLALIHLNKTIINNALEKIGGTKLLQEAYISSTESTEDYNYNILNIGYIDSGGAKDVKHGVRFIRDIQVTRSIRTQLAELEELNAILVDANGEADDPIVNEGGTLDPDLLNNYTLKSDSIKSITRSGNTFVATRADNTVFTFDSLDTDTTYTADKGITLNGNTFELTSGIVAAGSKGPTSVVTGNNNATVAIPRITVDTYGRVTGLTSYNLTCKNTTYSAATTSVDGLMSSTDKSRLDFMHSSSAVTTLTSLPAKAIVTATLSAATTISLASALTVGQSITVICTPTASFTQPIPTSGSFISMDGDSLSVTSGKVFEINILCYASGKYSISCKTAV